MERRHSVVAHAGDTTERGLMNPNAELGMPGSVIMEWRRPIFNEELLDVAHHCERMYARYSDAVLALKRELGIGAYGDPIGEDAYDE